MRGGVGAGLLQPCAVSQALGLVCFWATPARLHSLLTLFRDR